MRSYILLYGTRPEFPLPTSRGDCLVLNNLRKGQSLEGTVKTIFEQQLDPGIRDKVSLLLLIVGPGELTVEVLPVLCERLELLEVLYPNADVSLFTNGIIKP